MAEQVSPKPKAQLDAEFGRRGTVLSPRAQERLLAYRFPGNVRELRNVLERALVLEAGPELQLDVIDSGGTREASGSPA